VSFYLRLSASKLRFEAREANRVEKERKNLRNNKIPYKQGIVKSAPPFPSLAVVALLWSPCVGEFPTRSTTAKEKNKKTAPTIVPTFCTRFFVRKKSALKKFDKGFTARTLSAL
jgi:hypothetical protein